MPKFRMHFSFLQGASYKELDWGPGTSQPTQPMGRVSRVKDVEAEDEGKAIEALGKSEQLTMLREPSNMMGFGWIENVDKIG